MLNRGLFCCDKAVQPPHHQWNITLSTWWDNLIYIDSIRFVKLKWKWKNVFDLCLSNTTCQSRVFVFIISNSIRAKYLLKLKMNYLPAVRLKIINETSFVFIQRDRVIKIWKHHYLFIIYFTKREMISSE